MGVLNGKWEDHEELIWQCDAGCSDYLRLSLDDPDEEYRLLYIESAFHLRPWFRSHGRFSHAWKALRGKPEPEHCLILTEQVVAELRAALKRFDVTEGGQWNLSKNAVVAPGVPHE